MKARCGRCGTEFAVAAAGRYQCPTCGTVNEVKGAPAGTTGMSGSGAAPGPGAPPFGGPSNPPPPEVPSNRISCQSCSFSFIVGSVDSAECPMCGEDVYVGNAQPE